MVGICACVLVMIVIEFFSSDDIHRCQRQNERKIQNSMRKIELKEYRTKTYQNR